MRLLQEVRRHLKRRASLGQDKDGAPADLELQAATAILLLEAAYGDEAYVWREHLAILRGLEQAFGLGRREVLAILGRADEIRPPVVKLEDVTEVIRDRYDAPQRAEILTLLWRVIAADARIEDWEEAFAAHVARSLGLDPELAAAARERAR